VDNREPAAKPMDNLVNKNTLSADEIVRLANSEVAHLLVHLNSLKASPWASLIITPPLPPDPWKIW
jgi:hypothetical protein